MKSFYQFSLGLAALLRGPGLMARMQQAWKLFQKSGWRGIRWELHRRLGGYNDYSKWVRRYDTLTPALREKISRRVAAMKDRPLISVLMPTYNPNPAWLREAIESVRGQIYPHWELCIADDASPSAEVREILKSYSETDPRIKVVLRPENGHISAASNSALELALGPWVALMDHDDLLPPHALFWVADCIAEHPGVQLIYSDEDKVDEGGHRFGPYFKSDWNVDLFRSQNMFSHLGVLSTELMRSAGGFRAGLEGSQDWDLVLRCMERVEPKQIQHIPRVLYHWRVHAESTARSMTAKPYAAIAGERALNEHFVRTGVRATAEHLDFGYRVHYALPDVLPVVSLIIPTLNGLHQVRQCVDSILQKTSYSCYEIIIVDNGSDDLSTLAWLKAVAADNPNIRVLRKDRNFNYSALNNGAAALAQGDVIALVNADIEVISPDWLSEMVSLALQPGVGAVGARLWYPDKTLQHAGLILDAKDIAVHPHHGMPAGRPGYGGRAALIQSFSAVSAACMVIQKSHYEQVGGFDEVNSKEFFSDVDFCLRLRASGLRNLWTPHAELFLHESAIHSRNVSQQRKDQFEEEAAYMQQRWGELLKNDPAYSPNLMLAREDFSYAWPPRLAPV
jgi:O-antigen biosynthesis protein